MRHTDWGGGDPEMDYHPVQGGITILPGMLPAKVTGISSGRLRGPLARVRLYQPHHD